MTVVIEPMQMRDYDQVLLFVFHQNESGLEFWQQTGWTQRVELVIFSRNTDLASRED